MPRIPPEGTTPNGDPEQLLKRHLREGESIFREWAKELLNAVDGLSDSGSIQRALSDAGERLDIQPLVNSLQKQDLRGQMLGAADADWEAANLEIVSPAAFVRSGGIWRPICAKLPNFTQKPFGAAVADFLRKQIVPKPLFDRMVAEAKRRAFTVAVTAKQVMLDDIFADLAAALAAGEDLRQFRARLEQRLSLMGWLKPGPRREVPTKPGRPWHVETIYRNNVHGSYARGRDEQMRQPAVVAARPYWQVVTLKADGKTRPTHAAAHGKVLRWDDPFWTRAPLPWGHNCVTVGTLVQGAFVGASRAFYAGKAIELTSAVGRRLTVTSQHPVLTKRGLVHAMSVRQGDELVCYSGEVSNGTASAQLGRSDAHEYKEPAFAEDVFCALANASDSGTSAVAPGPEDFHGEARYFQSQVDVVGTYGELARYLKAMGCQEARQLFLKAPHARQPALMGPGGLQHLGARPLAAPGCLPGGATVSADDVLSVGRGEDVVPLESLCLGAAAQLNTSLPEAASENIAGYTAFLRELLHRSAGAVFLDKVVEVREFDLRGHVFDFQTVTGWIVADSVFTSNCRCRKVSRSAADVQRLGLKVSTGADMPRLPDPGWS